METEKVNKELVKADGNSPAEMIRMAVSGGADLEKMHSLLDLQVKWEQNEARKAFASAFALVQENIKAVIKKSNNPQTRSKYANLEGVIEASRPIYTKQGFSVIFYEGDTDKPEHVRICADVLHNLGHRETYHYDVPLDGKGIQGNANMTKIHGKASSTSYARRYLMCMIWNISTMDDDGNSAEPASDDTITEEQVIALKDHMLAANVKEEQLMKFLKVERLDEILQSQYLKAVNALKAKAVKK